MLNNKLKLISQIGNVDLSNLNNIYPVPVGEIAKRIGLKIKFIKMPKKQSGKLEKNIIYVNDNQSASQNLFAIAHYMGRYILNLQNKI